VKEYTFYTVDVFTDKLFGGNPLAVFPAASGLSSAQMQKIAREFNLSETAFILPSQRADATCTVKIFTPGGELLFAGHPTIGSAFVLAITGQVCAKKNSTTIFLEEGIGIVPVKIVFRSGDLPVYSELSAAQMPEYGNQHLPLLDQLAAMLSLNSQDLLQAQAISCGLPFVFVQLSSRESLKKAQLQLELWQQLLADCWASSVYLFYRDGEQIYARMFAPGLGIREDPATGSAATALAGLLCKDYLQSDGTLLWKIEQGMEIDRPSFLQLEADIQGGNITAIRVGGSCVLVTQGIFKIN